MLDATQLFDWDRGRLARFRWMPRWLDGEI